MIHAFKIAWRYLTSSTAQTALLITGVAVGVFVFIFMSALIGGLGRFLVLRTLGDVSHVTVEAQSTLPDLIITDDGNVLLAQQSGTQQRESLKSPEGILPVIESMRGVAAVSPQIVGNGFVVRGQTRAPVAVTGVEPNRVSAIADLDRRLVAGSTVLSNSSVLIGASLAEDLGVVSGQTIRLQSDRNIDRTLVVAGIYSIGVEALDSRSIFVTNTTARGLFDLPQDYSRIEIKLSDFNIADDIARRIRTQTGAAASSWTESNAQLLDGLSAQARSGDLIKGFALVTIIIGVASALLLSTYRRRPEIGIMRAFGATQRFVITVFVLQGALIGILGALIGAGLGFGLLSQFPLPEDSQVGGLPIDYRLGSYWLAISLTALGAILASILPARSAARIDPVSVIGQ